MLGFSVEGGHARLVRQGAGRGALPARVLEHLRDRAAGHRILPAAGLSAGLPDRHHDAHLGDARLHLRAAAALDLRPGAHLCLDGAFGPQRGVQSLADRRRDHQRPAAAPAQFHRRADRHGACAAALHGAADLRRGAPARSRHRRGGRGAGRLQLAHLLAHLRAAHPERHLRRLGAGLRAVARLLHHAGAPGRRPGDDDRRPDRAAGARDPELAVCGGAVGRAARLHLRRLCAGAALYAHGESRHEPAPARRGLRADLLLPDAAAAGRVPDLAQLGALHAVSRRRGSPGSGTSAISTIRNGSMPPGAPYI